MCSRLGATNDSVNTPYYGDSIIGYIIIKLIDNLFAFAGSAINNLSTITNIIV